MQATAGPFSRADAVPTQPQGRSGKHFCGVSTEEVHAGGGNGRFLGRRGLSEANFSLAVPAPHRTIHRYYALLYKVTVRTVKSVPYHTLYSAQA
jgi:hypothetical protein